MYRLVMRIPPTFLRPSTTRSHSGQTPTSLKTEESQVPATAPRRQYIDPEIAEDAAIERAVARLKRLKARNLTLEEGLKAAFRGE